MGSTSPKTTRSTVMVPMAMGRPTGPKISAAMAAAKADAAICTRVVPTRSVTRRSWGRLRSGWSALSPEPRSSDSRLSRARPREKYAASAPVSSAEMRSSASELRLCTEVLVARRHGHGLSGGVHEDDPRLEPLDLPDDGERGARRSSQAVRELLGLGCIAGQEQLVVLATRNGPSKGLGLERPRDISRAAVHRNAIDGHAGSHAALPADVPEIRAEPVGDIHHGVDARGGPEPPPLGHARGRAQMRERARLGGGALRTPPGLEGGEPGRAAPERSRDGDQVARLGRGAKRRRPVVLAQEGDVDEPAGGRDRGVAAHDDDAVGGGGLPHAVVERRDIRGIRRRGQRESDERPARTAALGRDVGEIHGHGLPADVEGRGPGAAKMNTLDQEIGGGEQAGPGSRLQHRGVVADAHHHARRVTGGHDAPDETNELELRGRGRIRWRGTSWRGTWRVGVAHQAAAAVRGNPRKLRRSALPWPVRMDSGWNWTPSTGRCRWRRPMISPSSALAETSSTAGRPWSSTTSEW